VQREARGKNREKNSRKRVRRGVLACRINKRESERKREREERERRERGERERASARERDERRNT
jgi:hypothetical protein